MDLQGGWWLEQRSEWEGEAATRRFPSPQGPSDSIHSPGGRANRDC